MNLGRRRSGRLGFTLLVAFAAGVFSAAPASAQDFKSFGFTVSPNQVEARSLVEFKATVTNLSKGTQKLGSANIELPEGFVIQGVSGPDAPATTSVDGRIVMLRYLSLTTIAPGNKATVTILARVPSRVGAHDWKAWAKSSQTYEDSNFWTLLESQSARHVSVTAEPPPTCNTTTPEGGGQCTARRDVDPVWLKMLNHGTAPPAGVYWVQTTVATTVAGQSLSVSYIADEGEGADVNRHGHSACPNYTSPSDAAVRFQGPNPKTVTYKLSPELANLMGERTRESCFSAPEPFVARRLDAPFTYDTKLWFNGLLDDCDEGQLVPGPCYERDLSEGENWAVIQISGVLPDPINR